MTGNPNFIKHNCDHYADHRLDNLHQRKYEKEADICIVGAGAAGGVLADELSRAGFRVVTIEAGPFWDPQSDFASDELSMQSLAWNDTRLVAGKDPLTMGHNNSGRGVGGGTVHFTGVFLRFHESDFKVKTQDGLAADWPITYQDLAPYYDKIEKDIAVSGPKIFPWGSFHGPYPYPEREPISANSEVFRRGCEKLGIRSTVAPLAILSAPFAGRPPCINRGFCNQGCLPNAKFSTLIHHIPRAIAHGAEILSDCMVTHLNLDKTGALKSVTFVHDRKEYEQKAKVFILANYCIETPRLLLSSACPQFPDGLANSSGMVGKNLMTHTGHDVYCKFRDEIRLYKGTPVLATSQEFYETEPSRGFVRGYTLNAHGTRPVGLAKKLVTENNIWGKELYEIMRDFNFYAQVTVVGEVLPNPGNSVTLSDEKDEYGLPRAIVTFSYGENDQKLVAHGVKKSQEILEAVGGEPAFVIPDTGHLMGTCPMGENPAASVVDGFCRSHDIPNLYICSAGVFVTSGGANPTETVMAIAARTADYIISEASK